MVAVMIISKHLFLHRESEPRAREQVHKVWEGHSRSCVELTLHLEMSKLSTPPPPQLESSSCPAQDPFWQVQKLQRRGPMSKGMKEGRSQQGIMSLPCWPISTDLSLISCCSL